MELGLFLNAQKEEKGIEDEYVGAFEGPEKTLEVCFTPGIGDPRGCRALERSALDKILAEARCEILSKTSNAYLDAYVLSESSLFVYPHKVVIKTCGRTTLLRCLRRLVELATLDTKEAEDASMVVTDDDDSLENENIRDKGGGSLLATQLFDDNTHKKKKAHALGLRLEWVGYSRKNYVFPDEQPSPHTSFGEELAYLKAHSKDSELAGQSAAFDGQGYVLGPITGDHWFVYISDQCERPSFMATERTINIMMFDLADEVRDAFYLQSSEESEDLIATGKIMTQRSGLASLVHADKSVVDAHAFAPCGYSMNALCFESYTTVHVTPEKNCSYASFETNTALKSYGSLVKNVLTVFKPKRVVVTLFADEAGLSELPRSATFDGMPRLEVAGTGTYQRADFSSLHVECDCICLMANYILNENLPTSSPVSLASGVAAPLEACGGTAGNKASSTNKKKKRGLAVDFPQPYPHVGSLQ
mmetsp:Transcript_6834/g.9562  ORF Transcript_6834/g.9562 Transcript_6834/m.9562 type:complete len:475 (+) Transcript_6834:337-1761(+)|eukprot:CAMPEP_0197290902 /NCGR_PEP_ID=MMETSP0890-20130614/10302_1 /TAXON_ID=44058 ORGANISM="Aureoumbra lagunensis, Strain CCMP1510" /NCGR_SAMPLE_ID=MMETSP0890 /ASSEMBLY_ACC=CAM_ASM_000533 /LENGTH=474 /DNA_ID=CAMNT_0042763269 /DNA_START=235 /DNA_END=1659 /DNA_ORIENTATION=+